MESQSRKAILSPSPRQVETATVLEIARATIERAAHRPRTGPALLAAISGIDGSGKTHLSKQLAEDVRSLGVRAALIGIDPWQHPQTIRFGGTDRGAHFYRNALRFTELFEKLVDPLVATRSIRLETKGIRTDRDVWDDLIYEFDGVDVVLLEGIFLFRQDLVDRFD